MPKGVPKNGINKGWFTRERSLGNKTRVGLEAWNKGKSGYTINLKDKAEKNRKLSEKLKGNKNGKGLITDLQKKRFSESMKRTFDIKGRKTPLIKILRNSTEYKLWRTAVFERDKYACIWCGQVGKKLNADHIKSFSQFPALRFAIDNGRTLCECCHKKTDNFGIKAKKINE